MEKGDKMKENEVSGPHRRFRNSNYLPVKLVICVCACICDLKISCRFSTFDLRLRGDCTVTQKLSDLRK